MPVEKDAGRIRGMFAAISPRYDLLNHLLSLNVDRSWRRRTVRELRLTPGSLCLDVCTGTADLALELAAGVPRATVIGADFTSAMLRRGEEKRRRAGAAGLHLVAADTLRLPFRDATFDAVTVAFGIRNVCDLEGGIREMGRVLKPGGQAAILEFSRLERGPLAALFRWYFHRVLPRLGAWVSGTAEGARAYAYLPQSVDELPPAGPFARLVEGCGFAAVRSVRLTLGIAHLHLATRDPAPVEEQSPCLASA
jgi:demethylmenaquinone methyltransferase/2-methoxy-6-polyprenyl-1,4-benzoquinol methylase